MAAAVQRKLVQRVSETVVTCEADTLEAEELRDETWLLRVASSNLSASQVSQKAISIPAGGL